MQAPSPSPCPPSTISAEGASRPTRGQPPPPSSSSSAGDESNDAQQPRSGPATSRPAPQGLYWYRADRNLQRTPLAEQPP
ncbi:hypothetical protein NUW54_g11342 [Trametes sanguinea]|uniref:Uncharacterized protein n=1 Tax=Trametes sanguinea TaxID=158606 RepID=A0ACC1NGV9_9APHY|nr:hypothetical protein NUW54_g11342 [Trametes sanguinea]